MNDEDIKSKLERIGVVLKKARERTEELAAERQRLERQFLAALKERRLRTIKESLNTTT